MLLKLIFFTDGILAFSGLYLYALKHFQKRLTTTTAYLSFSLLFLFSGALFLLIEQFRLSTQISFIIFTAWLVLSLFSAFKVSLLDAILLGCGLSVFLALFELMIVTILELLFSSERFSLLLFYNEKTEAMRATFLFFIRIFFCFLCSIQKKRQIPILRTSKKWLLLSSFFVLCLFEGGYRWVLEKGSWSNKVFQLCILCSSLLIFLLHLTYWFIISDEKKINDSKLFSEKMVYYEEYLENIKNHVESISKVNHDFKKHLNVACSLFNDDSPERAKEYLTSLLDDFNSIQVEIFTGNLIIDAILSDKSKKARAENIRFEVNARCPKDLPFLEKDLCAVLFNLLDNAIEACKRIDNEEKYIELYLDYSHSMLLIKCVNSTTQTYLKTTPIPNKGYGLKIIRSIVTKYNGVFKLDLFPDYAQAIVFMMGQK